MPLIVSTAAAPCAADEGATGATVDIFVMQPEIVESATETIADFPQLTSGFFHCMDLKPGPNLAANLDTVRRIARFKNIYEMVDFIGTERTCLKVRPEGLNMKTPLLVALFLALAVGAFAIERPGVEYKIFQFPADKIPRIDGDTSDWSLVPESYSIGMDQLKETQKGRDFKYDKKDLDVKVKVGWVKGLNRLYFLYEAYDNFWDFDDHSRHGDIFEIVVDGDLSGGPLVSSLHQNTKLAGDDAFFQFHGVHAQNYHIFTPAPERDWAFVWGCQPWIKELPWSNAAYNYNFKHGESGKLTLEFWITPFDYAPFDGPERAVVSKLTENKRIGLSWAVLDYDGPDEKDYKGFWNLSHKTTMYGNADDLVAFRLMPLDAKFRKSIDAHWSYKIIDMDRRLLAFQDESTGQITSWRWDFGDGTGSTDQHPIHRYEKAGEYIVNLYIEGPGGKSRWTKIRDVVVR